MSIEPADGGEVRLDGLRIVYFGMRCTFSVPPLRALIASGVEIAAVLLPGWPGAPEWTSQPRPAPGIVPIATSSRQVSTPSVDEVARAAAIPVFAVADLEAVDIARRFGEMDVDALVVACFPRRIPTSHLCTLRLGGINIHPSLLPRWRGPDPLFWTFRAGDREAGVTVHQLEETFDTGPIWVQRRTAVRHGERLPELDLRLAVMGGEMVVPVLANLRDGNSRPCPQPGAATWARTPAPDDFVVLTTRNAEWAFTFVRAVAPLKGPLRVVDPAAGTSIAVADALEWSTDVDGPTPRDDETIEIRFVKGWVRFRLAETPHRSIQL